MSTGSIRPGARNLEFKPRSPACNAKRRPIPKLAGLAGVGLGDFSTCTDERYPGLGAEQLVAELIAPLRIPLVTGLPFGHVKTNFPWAFGCRAKLDADRGELQMLERGVSVAP